MGNIGSCQAKKWRKSYSAKEAAREVLVNKVLLETLFGFFSCAELLQIRGVNSQWKEIEDQELALRQACNCNPKFFLMYTHYGNRFKHYDNIVCLAESAANYRLPCTKFAINMRKGGMTFLRSIEPKYERFRDLYHIISRSASYLAVEVNFNDDVLEILPDAEYPRLKTLTLSVNEEDYEENSGIEILKHFVEVVKTALLLNTLSIYTWDVSANKSSYFMNQIKCADMRKLKHLTFSGFLNCTLLTTIRELNLELRSLRVGFLHDYSDCVPLLKQLINDQSKSLQKLELGFSDFKSESVWSVWLPYMRQLKSLNFFAEVWFQNELSDTMDSLSVDSYSFLPYDKFTLSKSSVTSESELACLADHFLTNVTDIVLPLPRMEVNSPDTLALIRELYPAFPTVQNLTVCIDLFVKLKYAAMDQIKILNIHIYSYMNNNINKILIKIATGNSDAYQSFYKNVQVLVLDGLSDEGARAIFPKWVSLKRLDLRDFKNGTKLSRKLADKMRKHFIVDINPYHLID